MVLSYSRDRKILRGLQHTAARVNVLSGVDSDASLHGFQLIWRSVDAHVVDPFTPQRIDVGIQLRNGLSGKAWGQTGRELSYMACSAYVRWQTRMHRRTQTATHRANHKVHGSMARSCHHLRILNAGHPKMIAYLVQVELQDGSI